ncbi:MAG: hypothetical protein FVQ76_08460 [Nitrospira sp.]|nr:hypothetical protein [Nitrospira sp.]
MATRRARENARRRSVYYVEHTTERAVGTTPGMEDDCMDAGGRATQGAVAEVESRREQRPRYAVARPHGCGR